MRRAAVAALVMGILALMPMNTLAQERDHVIDDSVEPSLLFVLTASSGSVEGDTLTLEGVPAVIYFSDRPVRIAGHMTVEEFVLEWDSGPGSFADVPPNAVLSVLGQEGVDDMVLELVAIEQEGDALMFAMVVLEGSPPRGPIGPASLFLDPTSVNPQITD